ncbi:FimV family protein [Pseudomonas fluorescens group sp.]|uniref:Membrane protein n=3 Tax=Pseudomonas fluorescens group TaxID=136843 RepID=C3JZT4_PSEFS|nr:MULTISPECIES: FimV/HubP family polar landmark protein [Pseudomonas fluorescens group]MBZ6456630.1 FimV family protein [Pseudomonas fluorescens group sp.]MBZ6462577.1 FimV family protein [Pseudomonas fluorescens group sp.]MBZ6471738.1 FimV family protein [Pseudomonas fluorescens group sp.]WQD70519.1 FimV/HubP family polar landmark protein [Pseudomonas marginalis]CAI2798382.1 Putative membrane protein [Pseudomonas fluorescens SBW25]
MVQVRKLVLAIAAASALSSGMAQALQLGEMTLKSKLNQPLAVEIELLDVGGLTASEITPSLASSQAFVDAGVDRQAFLNDLTFTPVINPNGRSVVRVTSSKPLPDAYVRFLLQVQWPNGRLMRDYSVLLDPAKFDQPAPTTAAPAPRLAAPSSTAPAVSKPAQHTTTPRDTLWEIAAKNRNGGSVQQTMLAIQALNPDAFIDGNINRLKTGQVLRLPDTVQSTALPQPQAIAEVSAQNAAWRQGRRAATNPAAGKQQLDATKRTQAGNAPASTNAKDNLSLVSAEAAKKGAKGKAGDSAALSDKLAMTQEQLDTTRRDNEELKSRAADLQSQLDKLQKLIQLKNDQLARLQAEKGVPAASATAATAAMPAQLAGEPAAAPAAPDAATATPAPAAPAPEPVKADAAPDSTEGKFNDVLTNPIVLGVVGGAAGLLVLLLLLLWARHRNARLEEEKHLRMARALAEEPVFTSNIDHDLPPDSFEGLEVPPPNVKLAAAPAPAPVAEPAVVVPTVASVLAPLAVAVAPVNANDALAQAQSHIDRGHLNQAADVLQQAIKHEPKRSDLRLKLMEVYGLQNDKDGFVSQERQLVANGENHAQVEQLKSRFPAMAVLAAGVSAAVAAAALDAQYVKDLLEDKPAPAQPEAFDTDFDLSLDDLEEASPAEVKDDQQTFESLLKQQTEANASPDDLSDFDLDLQLDAPASAQSDDDFLSGLEDQMKDVPAVEPPTLTPAALDDFDLPEDFDLSLADEPEAGAKPDAFASELDDVNAELDRLSQSLEHPSIEPSFTAEDAAMGDDEPEFDFLSGTDEVATKLDLAQAYIDMGDADGARDILSEVLTEGDEAQRGEAKEMLGRI